MERLPVVGAGARPLRGELSALGLDPSLIELREVETDDAAERERFVGSPTIRIDGRDVQEPGDEPTGLSCRVYRLRDGRVSPLPAGGFPGADERAGRARNMGREPETLCGRPCDQPDCAASANP